MLHRDPARNRPPADRPLDIVGLELLLCVTQALLAGMLLSAASEFGGDARTVGWPVPGLTALLGLTVGAAWIWWLMGESGWPMTAVNLAVALLAGALWLLSLQDTTAPRIDPLFGLVAVSCAVYGIIAGVFLPGPRRGQWKGGVSQPRRGMSDVRLTPARFSPQVQKLVDERLANMTMPRIARPAIGMPNLRPSKDESAGQAAGALVAATPAPPKGSVPEEAKPNLAVTATSDTDEPISDVPEAAGSTSGDGGEVPERAHRFLPRTNPVITPNTTDDEETLPFPIAEATDPEHPDGEATTPG